MGPASLVRTPNARGAFVPQHKGTRVAPWSYSALVALICHVHAVFTST